MRVRNLADLSKEKFQGRARSTARPPALLPAAETIVGPLAATLTIAALGAAALTISSIGPTTVDYHRQANGRLQRIGLTGLSGWTLAVLLSVWLAVMLAIAITVRLLATRLRSMRLLLLTVFL